MTTFPLKLPPVAALKVTSIVHVPAGATAERHVVTMPYPGGCVIELTLSGALPVFVTVMRCVALAAVSCVANASDDTSVVMAGAAVVIDTCGESQLVLPVARSVAVAVTVSEANVGLKGNVT